MYPVKGRRLLPPEQSRSKELISDNCRRAQNATEWKLPYIRDGRQEERRETGVEMLIAVRLFPARLSLPVQ